LVGCWRNNVVTGDGRDLGTTSTCHSGLFRFCLELSNHSLTVSQLHQAPYPVTTQVKRRFAIARSRLAELNYRNDTIKLCLSFKLHNLHSLISTNTDNLFQVKIWRSLQSDANLTIYTSRKMQLPFSFKSFLGLLSNLYSLLCMTYNAIVLVPEAWRVETRLLRWVSMLSRSSSCQQH
jgi:hypothetical protein